MKEFIEKLIEDKRLLYQKTPREMVAEFNREQDTVKGYNGRQLLELLQNCDDEGSQEVLIKHHVENRCISISNNGTPFSTSGYESLFTSNLSPKRNRRQYIGNKGLGFRSIINWSKIVEIHSNDIRLSYSEENRINRFNELFTPDEQKIIRHKHNIGKKTYPIPYLTLPQLKEERQNDYITSIYIYYKEEALESILEQVEHITSETLLFLNSIETVNFSGFEDKEKIVCKRALLKTKNIAFGPAHRNVFNDSTWSIFEKEGELPPEYYDNESGEIEYYQIKIAVDDVFNNSSPFLYSFFPTNIILKQPYILHATFDLDSTRNQIIDSDKNKFILDQIVNFTVAVAHFYAKSELDYRPLQLLYHKHTADTLDLLDYYDLINDAIESEAIFPCIDGTYKKLEDVVYVSDSFANMIVQIEAQHLFSFHLLPKIDNDLVDLIKKKRIKKKFIEIPDIIEIINKIASIKLSVPNRALLISEILKNSNYNDWKTLNQFNVLINESGKIIKGEEYIYTPVTNEYHLKTPSFSNIQFLNTDLFNYLLALLNYDSKTDHNKSRFLADEIEGYCNIHSYEPATIAQKIISETNNKLKETDSSGIEYVREMNACLFHNYKQMNGEGENTLRLNKIPTITLNNEIKQTSDVVLSKFYPKGEITSTIFDGIYTDSNYVGSPEQIGIFDIGAEKSIEDYLLWLNVNRFVKYNSQTAVDGIDRYFRFIKKLKPIVNSTGYHIKYSNIENIECILQDIPLHKFILWVYFDEKLKSQLNDYLHTDRIRNYFRSYHEVSSVPSYLKFLVYDNERFNFDDFLLDEKLTWANDIQIDYKNDDFIKYGLTKTAVNEILISLGAQDDFDDLSINKIADIINKVPFQFPDGKKSSSIYKKALGHYRWNKVKLERTIKVFADVGNDKMEVLDSFRTFYSDKVKLPDRLKKQFPLFNFPPRAGGAEAIHFFKVKDLSSLTFKINSYAEFGLVTKEFNQYLEKLKPLMLTQRLNLIEDKAQQKQLASTCRKINIILCSALSFQIENYNHDADLYEYLQADDHTYYLRVDSNDTLKGLRQSPAFTNAFADLISFALDISGGKTEFKNLIRYEFDEVLENTKIDYGEDSYLIARELLGLADYKNAFWQAILKVKGHNYPEEPLDDTGLEELIFNLHGINIEVGLLDYEKLNEPAEFVKLISLFGDLQIGLYEFSENYTYPISAEKYHFKKLKDAILSYKPELKSQVWSHLLNKSNEEQAGFLSKINHYENYDLFAGEIARKHAFEFDINLSATVQKYITLLYGKMELIVGIDLEKIKKHNLSKFNEHQHQAISQNERFKSLIYFESALGVLAMEIEELSQNQTYTDNTFPDENLEIVDSEHLSEAATFNLGKQSNVYTPKLNDEKIRKEKGNLAELAVVKYLVDNGYQNVYHASFDNEGLHYDIRYTNIDGTVKYVEAKKFDYNYFTLSKDQYEFGERNSNDYEIWLVKNTKILIPIKDFYKNPKYKKIANEYIVYLKF